MQIIAFLILMTSATFAQVAASHTSKSDAEKIALAMKAGAKFVTRNATVLDRRTLPGGEYRALRRSFIHVWWQVGA
jgi:hypothetical protein